MVDYPSPPQPPTSTHPFWSDESYWRMKIPQNAPLHPNSAQMIDWLINTDGHHGGVPDIGYKSWTKPLYDAYENTPKYTVYKSDGITVRFYNVPIDPTWEPASDADHSMGIIDWYNRDYYDFWNMYYEGGKWKSGAGWKFDMDSDGISPNGQWTCGGSGIPMLAVAIRDEEIEAGVINHPLGCGLHTPKKGYKVYPPASTTDGKSTSTYAIPEGARIQLNPNLDLDSLGLTRTQKIIAKAMQEYGIMVKESAGTWHLYAEHENSVGDWSDWGLSGGTMMIDAFKDQWRIVDYSVFGAIEEPYP